MGTYIGNAFSGSMVTHLLRDRGAVATLRIERVEPGDVPAGAQSIIGHEDTARLVSAILGRDVQVNRVSLQLQPGDTYYWAQYEGPRLSPGATSLPDGARFVFLKLVL
jgi:hypothetical protein